MTASASPHLGKTLSQLWLFAILNMISRDIHEMTMASTLNDILSGQMNGNPMSEGVLLAGAFAVDILLLAFLLSCLLHPKAARTLNLILVPIAVFGIFYVPPADPDEYFFAAVVICTLAVIFTMAWRWDTGPKGQSIAGGRYVA